MINDETMVLSLRRINVCDIRLALTGLINDMKQEHSQYKETENVQIDSH